MTTTTTLPTQNEAWGFWGTTESAGFSADRGWDVASTMIAKATGADAEAVRAFLDSRDGRHFADDVNGQMLVEKMPVERATGWAIERWQGWRIDRRTMREHGIPNGLPYLTGWVHWHGQNLDA